MMHNPPHPGLLVKECLKSLHLTITVAAEKLKVTRKSLSQVLNGKTGISPEMALKLAKLFNTSAESWLTQQMHYDLWKTKQKLKELHKDLLLKSQKAHHHSQPHC